MKKLENLEKYVLYPNTQFFGTYFYDGEDIELHNQCEEFKDDDGNPEVRLTIIDTIENGIFKKYKLVEDLRTGGKEETKREIPMKEGDKLIFVMNEGFTQTHSKLIPIQEAIDLYSLLINTRSDDNDTEGNETESSSTN